MSRWLLASVTVIPCSNSKPSSLWMLELKSWHKHSHSLVTHTERNSTLVARELSHVTSRRAHLLALETIGGTGPLHLGVRPFRNNRGDRSFTSRSKALRSAQDREESREHLFC
jgi:hypothetical protein